ncbi:MAG: type II secretion system protein [Thermodesulfovibrionales bacterium]|nr:type II secretion system protein [Thermodesulfovibrionales bacterium]
MKKDKQRGFSVVEMVIVVSMITIVSVIALPTIIKFQRDYKFWDYSSQVEYLVKYAKIYAMEHTTNVGICVSNNQLTIRDLGPTRSANACSGSDNAKKSMNISDHYISMTGSNNGSVVSIDPRGVAIFPGAGGYICLSCNNKYFKVSIGKTVIRTEKGSGGCS